MDGSDVIEGANENEDAPASPHEAEESQAAQIPVSQSRKRRRHSVDLSTTDDNEPEVEAMNEEESGNVTGGQSSKKADKTSFERIRRFGYKKHEIVNEVDLSWLSLIIERIDMIFSSTHESGMYKYRKPAVNLWMQSGFNPIRLFDDGEFKILKHRKEYTSEMYTTMAPGLSDEYSTPDVRLLMQELYKLEETMNATEWCMAFVIPMNAFDIDSKVDQNLKSSFTAFVKTLMENSVDAILRSDWQGFRCVLANLDIKYKCQSATQDQNIRHFKIIFRHRSNQFFLAEFQAILLDHTLTIPKRMHMFVELIRICSKLLVGNRFVTRNCLSLYVGQVTIYAAVHGQFEGLKALTDFKPAANFEDIEFRLYCVIYKRITTFLALQQSLHTVEEQWLSVFQSIWELLNSEEDNGTRYLVLIHPFMVSAVKSGSVDETLPLLTNMCIKEPWLLPQIADILNRVGLQTEIGQLIKSVINQSLYASFIHRFPFVLHYVRHASIENDISKIEDNIRILFNFLDFGSNRTRGDAWFVMHFNLTAIQPIPHWVYEEWQSRADWWPRFHQVPLQRYGKKRRKVFDILNGLVDAFKIK